MSQEKIGLENLDEQLDKIIDEYTNATKTARVDYSNNIEQYFNYSRDDIEALSKEERYYISIQLSQYSIYLQRILNREKARLSWCNAYITNIASKHWEEHSEYLKFDLKVSKIAKEHSLLDKVIKIKNNAQIRIDELDGVSPLIKHLSEVFLKSTYVNN